MIKSKARRALALLVLLAALSGCKKPEETTTAAGGLACAPTQFEAGGKCFDTKEQACTILACPGGSSCVALETAPARVSCAPGGPGLVCAPTQFEAGGRCYATREEACAGIGCGDAASCLVAETAPAQVRCAAPAPGTPVASCKPAQFVAGGACYDTEKAACAALKCARGCSLAKSNPPQVLCN
jgi:hypothetical protein